MKWYPKSSPKISSKSSPKGATPKGDTPKGITPKGPTPKGATPKGARPARQFQPKHTIDDDRRVYGIHAVQATLTHAPERAKKLIYVETNARIEPILELAQSKGIVVEKSIKQIFDVNYGSDIVHQGLMLVTEPFPYVMLESALSQGQKPELVVVLDSIEDPRNLGRAARSAFAMGAGLLIIQSDRAAAVTASAEKAAVGTLARLPVARVTNLNQAIEKLKKAGLWVVGAADDAKTSLWSCDLTKPTAIVIGSEESGLRKLVRSNCDEVVGIPMATSDLSLNAADALTLMLYEATRQKATK